MPNTFPGSLVRPKGHNFKHGIEPLHSKLEQTAVRPVTQKEQNILEPGEKRIFRRACVVFRWFLLLFMLWVLRNFVVRVTVGRGACDEVAV